LISKIIDEFDYEYLTVGSLENIIKQIEDLPLTDRELYYTEVLRIEAAINTYLLCDDNKKRLSDAQASKVKSHLLKLCALLRLQFKSNPIDIPSPELKPSTPQPEPAPLNSTELPEEIPPPLQNKADPERDSGEWEECSLSGSSELSRKFSEPFKCGPSDDLPWALQYKNQRENKERKPELQKLGSDSLISEIVFILLTELSRNILSSSLTTPIQEYFEDLSTIPLECMADSMDILTEIQNCLEDFGWNVIKGGFHSEPKRANLVERLNTIAQKHFY